MLTRCRTLNGILAYTENAKDGGSHSNNPVYAYSALQALPALAEDSSRPDAAVHHVHNLWHDEGP